MNIENQVASLELSKKLKELGVKQESVWYWVGWYGYSTETIKMIFSVKTNSEIKQIERDFHIEKICSAFTVAELGEMLPECYSSGKTNLDYMETNKEVERFYCQNNNRTSIRKFADIEADARAKMLIWFIENKRVEVEEL